MQDRPAAVRAACTASRGHWKGLTPRLLARAGRDRRAVRDAASDRRGADARCRRASRVHPKIAPHAARRRRASCSERRPIDWALRRGAGLRLAAAGRHAGAAERPGQPPRHLQPAARRRCTTPAPASRYIPLQRLGAGPGAVPRLRQPAVRGGGARLRVRLLARRRRTRWCCGRRSSATSLMACERVLLHLLARDVPFLGDELRSAEL